MNRIYRTVFNRALNIIQVASEMAKNYSGRTSSEKGADAAPPNEGGKALTLSVLIAALFGVSWAFSGTAWAQFTDDKEDHNTNGTSSFSVTARDQTLYYYSGALPTGTGTGARFNNTIYNYNNSNRYLISFSNANSTFTITGLNAASSNAIEVDGKTYGQTEVQLIRLVHVTGTESDPQLRTNGNGSTSGVVLRDVYAPNLDGAGLFYGICGSCSYNGGAGTGLTVEGKKTFNLSTTGYGFFTVTNIVGHDGAAVYLGNDSRYGFANEGSENYGRTSNVIMGNKTTIKDITATGDIGSAFYYYRTTPEFRPDGNQVVNQYANLTFGTNLYFFNNKATAATGTSAVYVGNQYAAATLTLNGNTFFKDNNGLHTLWFGANGNTGTSPNSKRDSSITMDSTAGDIVFADQRGDIYIDSGDVAFTLSGNNHFYLDDPLTTNAGATVRSFSKAGTGVLQLTGTNALTLKDSGATFAVTGGELRLATLNGNRASLNLGGNGGKITMAANTKLSGEGDITGSAGNTFTTVTFAPDADHYTYKTWDDTANAFTTGGSTTVAAAKAVGTLNIAGDTAISAGTFLIDLSGNTRDTVNINGALTLTGANKLTLGGTTANLLSNTNYAFLTSTGTFTDSATAWQLTNTSLALTGGTIDGYSISARNGTVSFALADVANGKAIRVDAYTLGNTTLYWTDDDNEDHAWGDISSSVTSQNWTDTPANQPAQVETRYKDGDAVIFGDIPWTKGYSSAGTVAIAAQGVAPGAVTFTNTAGHDYVLAGDIKNFNPSTPTTLAVNGAGKVTLAGDNTYTGTTTVANGGTLQIGGGVVSNVGSITSNVALGSNAEIIFSRAGDYTYTNRITTTTGSSRLTKEGAGTLTLTDNNNLGTNGLTTLAGGKLKLGTGGNLGSVSGNIVTAGGTEVIIDHGGNSYTFSGSISGEGALTKEGMGNLILSGANTVGGGTTVNGGVLQIGNGGSGSLVGNINLAAGNLVINLSIGATHTGNITGQGSFSKRGTGTVELTGTNDYQGNTSVEGGTLKGNIAQGTNLTLENATTYDGASGSTATQRTVGELNGTEGTTVKNTNGLTVNTENDAIFDGSIDNTNVGGLTKQGNGTLYLTGSTNLNTYAGDTTVEAGALVGNISSQTHLTVNSGASYDTDELPQSVTGLNGAGSVSVTAVSHNTVAPVNNDLVANPVTGLTVNTAQGDDSTFSGVINGAGTLIKEGVGTLTLTGANQYQGGTLIKNGVVEIKNGSALGSWDSSGSGANGMDGAQGLVRFDGTHFVDNDSIKIANGDTITMHNRFYGAEGDIVFDVGENANLTVSDVKVSGDGAQGGAVYAGQFFKIGSLAGSHVTFDNNELASANGRGGAILWDSPDGTVLDGWVEGAGVVGTFTLQNNKASGTGGSGGAAALQNRTGSGLVRLILPTNTYFNTNSAQAYGGAIYAGPLTELTLNGSTFLKDNTAGTEGGAVYLSNGVPLFLNSGGTDERGGIAFSGNTTTANGSNSVYLAGNNAVTVSGGVNSQGEPANVRNIYFDDPLHSGGSGSSLTVADGFEGFVQFTKANVLNAADSTNNKVNVNGGTFRLAQLYSGGTVSQAASFDVGGASSNFTLAARATLSGEGQIKAGSFDLFGIVSPDSDHFQVPPYNGELGQSNTFDYLNANTAVSANARIGEMTLDGDVTIHAGSNFAMNLGPNTHHGGTVEADRLVSTGNIHYDVGASQELTVHLLSVAVGKFDLIIGDGAEIGVTTGTNANGLFGQVLGPNGLPYVTTNGARITGATLGHRIDAITGKEAVFIDYQSGVNKVISWRGGTNAWDGDPHDAADSPNQWSIWRNDSPTDGKITTPEPNTVVGTGIQNFQQRDFVYLDAAGVADIGGKKTFTFEMGGEQVSGMVVEGGDYTIARSNNEAALTMSAAWLQWADTPPLAGDPNHSDTPGMEHFSLNSGDGPTIGGLPYQLGQLTVKNGGKLTMSVPTTLPGGAVLEGSASGVTTLALGDPEGIDAWNSNDPDRGYLTGIMIVRGGDPTSSELAPQAVLTLADDVTDLSITNYIMVGELNNTGDPAMPLTDGYLNRGDGLYDGNLLISVPQGKTFRFTATDRVGDHDIVNESGGAINVISEPQVDTLRGATASPLNFEGEGNVVFSLNRANYGGAVATYFYDEHYPGADAMLDFRGIGTLTFDRNFAAKDGAAVYASTEREPDAGFTTGDTMLTFGDNVTFTGNRVGESGKGGGTSVGGTASDGGGPGGGISAFSTDGTTSVTFGHTIVFQNNAAYGLADNVITEPVPASGGAIYVESKYNNASVLLGGDVLFSGNVADSENDDPANYSIGGAIAAVARESGNANVYVSGSENFSSGDHFVTFENNQAGGTTPNSVEGQPDLDVGGRGGAIAAVSVDKEGNDVSGDVLVEIAEGVQVASGASLAINFTGNTAHGGNGTDASGGAIYANSAKDGSAVVNIGTNIDGAGSLEINIVGNTAGDAGGAIDVASRSGTASVNVGGGATIDTRAMTFADNTAGTAGGAIHASSLLEDANITIGDNATFRNNTAGTLGGAIFRSAAEDGKVTLGNYALFDANTAENGGAIFTRTENNGTAENPLLVIGDHTSFINNVASGTEGGGAILAGESSDKIGAILLSRNTYFTGNTAENGTGGAILAGNNSLSIQGHTFFNGNSAANGGAIAIGGADLPTLTLNTGTGATAGEIAFDGNSDAAGESAVLLSGAKVVLQGTKNIYFDDPILSNAGKNTLVVNMDTDTAFVQFTGNNVLDTKSLNADAVAVDVQKGTFRVVNGATFDATDTGSSGNKGLNLAANATLAGGGTITADEFTLSGVLKPDQDTRRRPVYNSEDQTNAFSLIGLPSLTAPGFGQLTLEVSGDSKKAVFDGATLSLNLGAVQEGTEEVQLPNPKYPTPQAVLQSERILVTGEVAQGDTANKNAINIDGWNLGTYRILTADCSSATPDCGVNSLVFVDEADITVNGLKTPDAIDPPRKWTVELEKLNNNVYITTWQEENRLLYWRDRADQDSVSRWGFATNALDWNEDPDTNDYSTNENFLNFDAVIFDKKGSELNSNQSSNVAVLGSGVTVSEMNVTGGTYTFTGETADTVIRGVQDWVDEYGAHLTSGSGVLRVSGDENTHVAINLETDFIGGVTLHAGEVSLGHDYALGHWDSLAIDQQLETQGVVTVVDYLPTGSEDDLGNGNVTIKTTQDLVLSNHIVVGDAANASASGKLTLEIAPNTTLTLQGAGGFSSDPAQIFRGGAIRVPATDPNALLIRGGNLVVTQNKADDGGGIAVSRSGQSTDASVLDLSQVASLQFNENTASRYGGAIALRTGAAVASLTLGGNVGFDQNAARVGGALYVRNTNEAADLTVGTFSTFSQNTASSVTTGEGGGAIYMSSNVGVTADLGDKAYFVGNTTGTEGGAISLIGGDVNLTLKGNTYFYDNHGASTLDTLDNLGGAIYAKAGDTGTINVTLDSSSGIIGFAGNTHKPDNTEISNAMQLDGNSTVLTISGSHNVYFDDPITAIGDRNKMVVNLGSGTLQFMGLNEFDATGHPIGETAIDVQSGTFRLTPNAVLNAAGGEVMFASGTTLAGSGTISSRVFTIEGDVSPDNDRLVMPEYNTTTHIFGEPEGVKDSARLGTLTLDGSVTFGDNAKYVVDIANNNLSDLLIVTGNLSISDSAKVEVHFAPDMADADPTGVWTIIEAKDNSTDKRFATQPVFGSTGTADTLFLEMSMVYDGLNTYGLYDSVKLQIIRNAANIPDYARTPNQEETAEGLEDVTGSPIYNEVTSSNPKVVTDDDLRNLLDELDGEIHASVKGALTKAERMWAGKLIKQAHRPYDEGGEIYLAQNANSGSSSDADAPLRVMREGGNLWASVDGAVTRTNADKPLSIAESKLRGGNLTVGVERVYDQGVGKFGVAVKGGRQLFDVNDRHSDANIDTYSAAIYGANELGKVHVTYGATYSREAVETTRNVTLLQTPQRLKADYSLDVVQVFGDVGYLFQDKAWEFEPYVGYTWTRMDQKAFTETGGTAALYSKAKVDNYGLGSLGVRGHVILNDAMLLEADLSWQRQIGGKEVESQFMFAGGTKPFTIGSQPLSTNAFAAQVGLTFPLWKNGTLKVAYDGVIGGSTKSHGGFVMLNQRW
jgi:autotransporter-associated beta strand protein/predicted outer membrane repeat protein